MLGVILRWICLLLLRTLEKSGESLGCHDCSGDKGAVGIEGGRSVVFWNMPGCLSPRPCCQGWDTWLCVYLVLSVSIVPPILTMSWEIEAVSLYLQQGEGGSVNARYLSHVTEKQETDCGLELRQLTYSAMVTVKTGQKPISLLLWLHGKSTWMPTSGGLGLSLLFCACGSLFCVPFP